MSEERFRNLGVLSIFLTGLTLITKLLGFVREVLVSAWFGASHETDAFYLVFYLVFVGMGAAAAQMPRVFIPEYQRREFNDQDKERTESSSTYLGASLLFFLPLAMVGTVVLGVWTDPLVALAAPNLPEPTHNYAVELVRVMLPIIPSMALIAVLSSLAHARGDVMWVQLATPLVNFGGVTGLLLLADSSGIHSLAIGLTAGSLLQCLVVGVYPLRKRLLPRISSEAIKKVGQGSAVLLLLALVNYSGGFLLILSERYFATGLPEGHLSCMGYALRLGSLPNQVLFGGLLVAMLPAISSRMVHQDNHEIERLTLRAIRMLFLLNVPILMGMALFSTPLVQVTFGRGAFDAAASELTALLLICYVPSLITEVIRLVIATVFFAAARPGPAIGYGILRVSCLTLAWAVTWESYGAMGMVLILSAVDVLGALVFIAMANKLLQLRFASLLPFLMRLLLASSLALLFANIGSWAGTEVLAPTDNLARAAILATAMTTGGIGFFLGARVVGLTELRELLQIIQGMVNRRLRGKAQ